MFEDLEVKTASGSHHTWNCPAKGCRERREAWPVSVEFTQVKKIATPTRSWRMFPTLGNERWNNSGKPGAAWKLQSFPKAMIQFCFFVIILQQNVTWSFTSTNSSTKALEFSADIRHGNACSITQPSVLLVLRAVHTIGKTWPTCAGHFLANRPYCLDSEPHPHC